MAELVVLFFAMRPWTTGDTREYLELAEGLVGGRFASWRDGAWVPEVLRPPGYPAFLAVVLHGTGAGTWLVAALQLALMVPTYAVAERITTRLGGPGKLFALLSVAYVFPLAYAAQISPEALSIFLVTVATAGLVRASPAGLGRAGLIGLASGLAALVRPNLILLPMLFSGLSVAAAVQAARGFPRALVHGFVLLCTAALVLTPYALRNKRLFGLPSPLPPAGALGNSLFVASWQSTFTQADVNAMSFGIVTENMRRVGFDTAVRQANERIGAPPETPPFSPSYYKGPTLQRRATRVLREIAIQRIQEHPGPYVHRVMLNQFRIWNTAMFPTRTPVLATWLLQGLSALVWGLGLGVIPVLIWRRVPIWQLAPSFVLLYFHGIHIWLHTEARYTAPARLLLVVNATVALTLLSTWMSRKINNRSAGNVRIPNRS